MAQANQTSVNQDVVNYVATTGKVFKQAEQLVEQLAREEAKVAEAAPKIATLLANEGLIRKTEHEVASKKLASHEGALEVVQNLLSEIGQQKRAFQQKSAAAGSGQAVDPRSMALAPSGATVSDLMRGGIVGGHAGLGEKRASDLAFEDILMGSR